MICFPGKDGQTLVNEINDEDDGSDSKVLVSFNNLSDGRQVVRNKNASFQLITKFMLKKQTKKQTILGDLKQFEFSFFIKPIMPHCISYKGPNC